MSSLYERLRISKDPFEHYVAEAEPNISSYAVRPPYFREAERRARSHLSFILFGDRGAGKSATRLTIYRDLWARRERGEATPLTINLTDFEYLLSSKRPDQIFLSDYVDEIGFLCIEAILTYLAALEESDRKIYTEALTSGESTLFWSLATRYYFSRPDSHREVSLAQTCRLLDQFWTRKHLIWIQGRWNALAEIASQLGSALASRFTQKDVRIDIALGQILSNTKTSNDVPKSTFTLAKLVELAKIFGFTGICALVDKVDEHVYTQNSAEAAAQLVYPILSNVQIMEVPDFAWIFFLWDKIKVHLDSERFRVRLDKLGFGTAEWEPELLRDLIRQRVRYYSSEVVSWEDMFVSSNLSLQTLDETIRLAMKSPRELIRLINIIIREFDQYNDRIGGSGLLKKEDVDRGCDTYVTDRSRSLYDERALGQLCRLAAIKFLNRDVQRAFRINEQSARRRIEKWENMGVVRRTGVGIAEGASGGKPPIQYSIIDLRVARIVSNGLMDPEDIETEDEEKVGVGIATAE